MRHIKFSKVLFGFCLGVLLAGGALADEKLSPETVEGVTTVTPEEAKALFDNGVIFVDVRKDTDWKAGRIPWAVHLELNKVFSEKTLLGELKSKDKPVVIYCNGPKCMRSSIACAKAVEWGFTKLYYLRLGYPAWKQAGYGIE